MVCSGVERLFVPAVAGHWVDGVRGRAGGGDVGAFGGKLGMRGRGVERGTRGAVGSGPAPARPRLW